MLETRTRYIRPVDEEPASLSCIEGGDVPGGADRPHGVERPLVSEDMQDDGAPNRDPLDWQNYCSSVTCIVEIVGLLGGIE
jgi:hypothetical protein